MDEANIIALIGTAVIGTTIVIICVIAAGDTDVKIDIFKNLFK